MAVGTVQETITVTSGAPTANRVTGLNPEAQRKLDARRAQAAAACAAPQTADGTPIGGNLRVPIKVRDVKPLYPTELENTEGLVVLNTQISTNGAVEHIEVASSTHHEFTQAAIEAVRQWEFDATRLNCEAIATPMQVTVNFRTAP
jgi:TonB family protein